MKEEFLEVRGKKEEDLEVRRKREEGRCSSYYGLGWIMLFSLKSCRFFPLYVIYK